MSAIASDLTRPKSIVGTSIVEPSSQSLLRVAGVCALFAMLTNLLDIVLGFGETDTIVNGSMSAVEWFSLFQSSTFKGLYVLGILNIVYMLCMMPVYFAVLATHRHAHPVLSTAAVVLYLLAIAVYVSNNAAMPMLVLSERFAAATSEAQKAMFAAAGEAALARGEDFTPGSFPGMFLSGLAAIVLSVTMLRGQIFGRLLSWIGIAAFTSLAIFTIVATFIPALYITAFYSFAMVGGLFALAWFVLVSRTLLRLRIS